MENQGESTLHKIPYICNIYINIIFSTIYEKKRKKKLYFLITQSLCDIMLAHINILIIIIGWKKKATMQLIQYPLTR